MPCGLIEHNVLHKKCAELNELNYQIINTLDMKNKTLITNKARHIFYALLCAVLLCSCEREPITKQVEKFEIQKFNGYKIFYKKTDDWNNMDWYVLRNDTIAIELRVPSWFSELYAVGDTIK